MAAKLLHTLADDNPDLQKQIGCMTGIFHALDRHHLVTGRRTTHNRITLGRPHMNTKFDRELINKYEQRGTDANFNRSLNEKQRLSTDSSRPSFSSSCSSSLSSSEFNKGVPPENSIFFQETPSREPMMDEIRVFSHLGHQSLDLRDVVRDSMYREARGLSVKTSARKEEAAARHSKRGDSPRPANLNESLRVLAKCRDASQYYNNEFNDAKDGPRNLVLEDAQRFSIDSRDGMKSTMQKLKELPRLSLDSRERVMHSSNSDSKTAQQLSKSLSSGNSSTQKRPPSVVAKLMGLETLPGSPLARDKYPQLGVNKSNTFENVDPFTNSLRGTILNRTLRSSPSSPRSLVRDPTSPRWKNPDFIMKPISNSRVPVELAPWKQLDRNRVLRKQVPVPAKVPSTSPNSVPTVYSEIEKRLKDIEFKQSGKDLRALKQIMEAIQSKGVLETQKEAQSSNFGTRRDYEPTRSAASIQNPRCSVSFSSSSSIGMSEAPIVIMKPAKLAERAGIPSSSLIPIHSLCKRNLKGKEEPTTNPKNEPNLNLTDKKSAIRNSPSSSTKAQQVCKESGSKSLGSISPRLQQKRMELDKRSRPPTPPDSSSLRKQSNCPVAESNPAGGKRVAKARQKTQQKNDVQCGLKSNGRSTISSSCDELCPQSDELCPQSDVEVTRSEPTQSVIETANNVVSGLMQNKSLSRVSKEESLPDLPVISSEHSPPSSPLKQIADNNEGNAHSESADENCEEDQWNPAYSFSKTETCGSSPEINRKKLQNIEHLVQKLRRLNSTHDEASQDYIASLCENTNPNSDHRYISEILLASGLLLRDLGSGLATFHLHPSGYPINPELFLVLEQTKGNYETKASSNCEKLRRKLVFDVVNETLVQKLSSAGGEAMEPWVKSMKTAMNAQQLLKELCFEIENLQIHADKRSASLDSEEENDVLKEILWEDVVSRSGKWTEFDGEISGLVLDIERLLFKDLVDEIVHGEAASGGRSKTGRRRMAKNMV